MNVSAAMKSLLEASSALSGAMAGQVSKLHERFDGLGTAARKNVGTDAGNVMPVGAFGWGDSTLATTRVCPNVDAFNLIGHYYANGSHPGTHPVRFGYVLHAVSNHVQVAYVDYEERVFTRLRINDNWGAWRENVHFGNVGLPIESGSNANGKYDRFPNGMLICRGQAGINTNRTRGAGTYTDVVTLPAAFVDKDYHVAANVREYPDAGDSLGSAVFRSYETRVRDTGSFLARGGHDYSSSLSYHIQFIAIGRWK